MRRRRKKDLVRSYARAEETRRGVEIGGTLIYQEIIFDGITLGKQRKTDRRKLDGATSHENTDIAVLCLLGNPEMPKHFSQAFAIHT